MTDEIINQIEKNDYRKIKIKGKFNDSIDRLPDCVEYISIDTDEFNYEIRKWPKNLRVLKMDRISYSKPIPKLPDTLEKLSLSSNFNYKNTDVIPENIMCLKIDSPLQNLEKFKKLTHLTIGNFNSLDKKINFPPNLTHLNFNCIYNFVLDNLPKTLSHLTLYYYNLPITNLPKNLRYLKIGTMSSHIAYLNPKLEHLNIELSWTIADNWVNHIHGNIIQTKIPDSLIDLKLNGFKEAIEFPSNLKKLKMIDYHNKLVNLPDSIKHLVLEKFNNKIKLPEKLVTLEMNEYNAEPFESFPINLKKLYIYYYSFQIKNLPSKLESINVTCYDWINNKAIIPSTLKSICINGGTFNDWKKSHIINRKYQNYIKWQMKDEDDQDEDDQNYKEDDDNDMNHPWSPPNHYENFQKSLMNIPSHASELEIAIGNKNYDLILPSWIKKLIINSHNYKKQLQNLPEQLIELEFKDHSTLNLSMIGTIYHIEDMFDSLPSNLKKLRIKSINPYMKFNNLPNSLEYFQLHNDSFDHLLDNLPDSLKHLDLVSLSFNKPLDNLPNSIKKLNLYASDFDKPLKNLPNGLEFLMICSSEINYRDITVPPSVKNFRYRT